jgi:hypothetical protein
MYSEKESHLLNSFLIVYFYKIETELNSYKNGLENIKFQSEEANTDEFLKKFFKNFLKKYNNIIDVKLKILNVKIDAEEHTINIDQLKSYQVVNVSLPEELTDSQKKVIYSSKKSVYTSPDLYLEITDGVNTYFESVELKSTKDNTIPGSSVQQVSPFEWVIFVKREKERVIVTTGFYINSITEKLPFPDRSPRPQIGFKTLLEWNSKYRKVDNNVLTIETVTDINVNKIKLLTDWQDYLASEWLDIIKMKETRNSERWFNNTIRKFTVKLIEYHGTLTEDEKETLKKELMSLIK